MMVILVVLVSWGDGALLRGDVSVFTMLHCVRTGQHSMHELRCNISSDKCVDALLAEQVKTLSGANHVKTLSQNRHLWSRERIIWSFGVASIFKVCSVF